MPDNKPYEYELIYRYRDMTSTVKFQALCDVEQLKSYLKTFLTSAGWSKPALDFLDTDEDA